MFRVRRGGIRANVVGRTGEVTLRRKIKPDWVCGEKQSRLKSSQIGSQEQSRVTSRPSGKTWLGITQLTLVITAGLHKTSWGLCTSDALFSSRPISISVPMTVGKQKQKQKTKEVKEQHDYANNNQSKDHQDMRRRGVCERRVRVARMRGRLNKAGPRPTRIRF